MESEQIKDGKVRKLALEIIHEVCENNAYTNIALERRLRNADLSQIDKNLVTEIVNGTIRMIKHLDWVLNLFLKRGINKTNPWIQNILRMSLYQIIFMDKIPSYALVNDAVGLAKEKTNHTMSKLVNGVLRNILRNLDKIKYPEANNSDYLSIYYSHPEWLVEELLKEYPYSELEEILLHNNARPRLHLRVNTLKTNRDDLIQELRKDNITGEINEFLPVAINVRQLGLGLAESSAYRKGYFYIQNAASMLAAEILAPKPGDFVYDLCSGVGGKATHLAELMDNCGEIHSYDIYDPKLSILNNNAKRLGISIISTYAENILDIKPTRLADAVLLDAPCSGLGVLNRRADLRWNKDKSSLIELNQLQSSLLMKASQMVQVGGHLLYATCTINRAENENVVNTFLQTNRHFHLVGFADKISFFPLDEHDRMWANKGMLTIISGKYQTDGMFYALLKRKDAN